MLDGMTRAPIAIEQKWRDTLPELNEKQQRYYAAREAKAYGFGGVALFSRATGLSRETVHQGIREVESGDTLHGNRIRRSGGGRKRLEAQQPRLIATIEAAADPKADQHVIVKHTSHSLDHITTALLRHGCTASRSTIARILHTLGYALKANKKDIEGGKDHPDRDAQLNHINMMGLKFQLQGFPILSIDAKKTEKIGNMNMMVSVLNSKIWHNETTPLSCSD